MIIEIAKLDIVVCPEKEGYLALLEVGKFCQMIPDAQVKKIGGLRAIDEDGEDSLYDAKMFFPLQVQPIIAQMLISLSKQG